MGYATYKFDIFLQRLRVSALNADSSKLAIVYARVSTEEQAKKGYSLPEQLSACRTKATSLGYSPERIVECVESDGAPGELLSRPGLDRARELVKQGGVGAFVCMDPDRFSRDLLNQLLIDRELQKAGVRLEFVLFNLERSPMGQAFFSFRGIMSELEKAMIKERTTRGKMGKAKQGGLTHSVGAYGFRFNRELDKLEEDDSPAHPSRDLGSKADMVRTMFKWASEGLGFNAIARRLNDLGVPSPRGSIWHRNTLQWLFRNESYTGTLYLHKHNKMGVSLNRYRPTEDRVKESLRPKDEWIPVSVPPLIDRETWEEAQHQLALARRKRSGKATRDYLLSGLVRCGLCGSTLHGTTSVNGYGSRFSWYVCTARSPGLVSKPKCKLPHLRAEPLEEAVWNKVREWVLDPDSLNTTEDTDAAESIQRELGMTSAGLGELTEARGRIVRLIAKGVLSESDAEVELAQLKASETRLLKRQQELSGQVTPQPSRGWRELAETVRDNLEMMDFEERQRLVRKVVAEVVVKDGNTIIRVR